MCSIILRLDGDGAFIGANRDEMVSRPWEPPGPYWPGVVAGRDILAGGTWLGMNHFGVVAAVLNRHGSLGPAVGKRSRGELPILALAQTSAAAAAAALRGLDTAAYRSFNLVVADAGAAFLLRGLEDGPPVVSALPQGVTMITAGEPNDVALPRIARHLPSFETAAFADWGTLLGDPGGDWESSLNIPVRNGFGTVCSSLIRLPLEGRPVWAFCAGPADPAKFMPVAI
jgi:hypothetical protein